MQLGMIGLGKMGANMVKRWRRGGHEVVACDRNADAVKGVVAEGAIGRPRRRNWSASSRRRGPSG